MELVYFGLVLLSGAFHSTWNILAKKVGQNVTVLCLGITMASLVLLPFIVHLHPSIPLSTMLLWAFLSGTIHVFYYIALTFAYYHYPVSTIYPISRGVGIVGGGIFGIVWIHDRVSTLGYLSVAMVLLGVCLFYFKPVTHSVKHATLCGLLVGFTIVIYIITDIVAIQFIPSIPHTIYLFLVMNIYLLVYFGLKKRDQLLEAFYTKKCLASLIGLCVLISYGLILTVLRENPVGSALALRETSIIMTAFLSYFFLKEPLSPYQWGAIFLICCGAICIKLS